MKRDIKKIKLIKTLREKGLSCREIGEKLGVSKQRVSLLSIIDDKAPERMSKWSNLYSIFISEYQEGYSTTEIAKKYNTSHQVVYNALKKNGIMIDKKRKKILIDPAEPVQA